MTEVQLPMEAAQTLSVAELRQRIARLPRARLAYLPTPLQECPRLTAALGGPRVLIKRDDLSGLALGGSNVRTLEFALGAAQEQGADTVVAGGWTSQSNYACQVAAAAARLGLHCVLVLRPGVKGAFMQGNLLLDRVLGAEVRLIEPPSMVAGLLPVLDQVADKLRQEGKKPYVLPSDASVAVGYVECALEICEQLSALDVPASHVFLASAGLTQAGLLAGARALGASFEVVGISPDRAGPERRRQIADLAGQAAKRLDLDLAFAPDDVTNLYDYVGASYGLPTRAGTEAIALVARSEAIVLDPISTGKAFAGLVDYVRKGRLERDQAVVFLHTGGTAVLFAYSLEMANALQE